ncbi:SMC-Scp complex subunit ScpB [Halocella sp. SP3-1]|uniref:SMC-Scp complex subunit ScpB n=1 Tax=Halocella sp. SP3-1 TaxID=2382161 RepID=UPI000F74D7EE|nr:SMC-Scp complex subunit ScpB [Halocella sp. SP3-1]AZO95606.1 SMC-Scp complex subunit ScpB [Halocella sp. SP3-1]
MVKDNWLAGIEALLFSTAEPISIDEMTKILNISEIKLRKYLSSLAAEYKKEQHGVFLKEYNGSYVLMTKPEYSSLIEDMYNKKITRLSQAALETLAIIAYKQPVTRAEIEEIRGVKAEKTLLTLGKYGLVEELGRKDTIGNPIVYGTTKEFLRHFDLEDLSELPEVEEED